MFQISGKQKKPARSILSSFGTPKIACRHVATNTECKYVLAYCKPNWRTNILLRSALFRDITRPRVVIVYRRFGTNVSVPSSRVKESPWRWGRCCPETAVKNYHRTPHNIPEERRSHQHRGGSLKSNILLSTLLRTTTITQQTGGGVLRCPRPALYRVFEVNPYCGNDNFRANGHWRKPVGKHMVVTGAFFISVTT